MHFSAEDFQLSEQTIKYFEISIHFPLVKSTRLFLSHTLYFFDGASLRSMCGESKINREVSDWSD